MAENDLATEALADFLRQHLKVHGTQLPINKVCVCRLHPHCKCIPFFVGSGEVGFSCGLVGPGSLTTRTLFNARVIPTEIRLSLGWFEGSSKRLRNAGVTLKLLDMYVAEYQVSASPPTSPVSLPKISQSRRLGFMCVRHFPFFHPLHVSELILDSAPLFLLFAQPRPVGFYEFLPVT